MQLMVYPCTKDEHFCWLDQKSKPGDLKVLEGQDEGLGKGQHVKLNVIISVFNKGRALLVLIFGLAS